MDFLSDLFSSYFAIAFCNVVTVSLGQSSFDSGNPPNSHTMSCSEIFFASLMVLPLMILVNIDTEEAKPGQPRYRNFASSILLSASTSRYRLIVSPQGPV